MDSGHRSRNSKMNGQRLNVVDVGLMRYLPAAILFLPVTLRKGLFPGGAKWIDVVAIAGLGGFVFISFLSGGLSIAPVADSGSLPCTL